MYVLYIHTYATPGVPWQERISYLEGHGVNFSKHWTVAKQKQQFLAFAVEGKIGLVLNQKKIKELSLALSLCVYLHITLFWLSVIV